MSQVLYRKYRPQNFGEVVGQDHIVSVLRESLGKGAISHAYLFHGGRGTGKTSIARILARELGTAPSDLYEIDAASNRSIDDIRELREGVKTVPFESKYKVYIVDEAHMLTREAWNAFLKTLEEPPAHAIFVLATTELHKVPDTILSRCEVYTFREPSHDTLASTIRDVAGKEGYAIDNATAGLIALLGEGSFRDSLGHLQKVMSGIDGKKITEADVERLLGVPERRLVRDFIAGLIEKDKKKALDSYIKSLEAHIDPNVFLRLVIHIARMGLLLRISPTSREFVQKFVEAADIQFLEDIVKKCGKDINSKLLLSLLNSLGTMKNIPMPEIAIEILVADIE